ncbi:MAG: DNA repair protein RecO [Flavobacteriaceae bacterium]|nr:DNA repair protein RecO [Flavobacteriaceae bacterium]|tara:strand:- start:7459 stop:8184 length:726 start_codon:yes stop_codon:yes gene_type:complete
MLISTEAIALSSIKYSESSLIVKCFTLSDGIKSYLLKGIRSRKKTSLNIGLFQPLTMLEIDANHKNKGNLENIRSAKILYPYKTIPFDIYKNAISLFLSETLSKSIKEEEKNESLYYFIKNSMMWFDSSSNYINFHLHFIIKFLKYLGISPDESKMNLKGFDMINGSFSNYQKKNNFRDGEVITYFKEFLGTNFDNTDFTISSSLERKELLEFLMKYLKIHLEDFKRPNSLNIMYDIFKRK